MTKIDIYVIINKNKYITGQTKDIVKGCPQNKTGFKHEKACTGSIKMAKLNNDLRELHADLRAIANYFIELFKITGSMYSCSRTKLGKLISIVAFVYAIKGEKLFDEKIYKYKTDSLDEFCGTGIQELNFLIGRDAYLQTKFNNDNNLEISCEQLNGYEKINSFLSSELKKIIEKVFLRFGAYNPEILGQCINPIILHKENILSDESVDLVKLSELSKNNFSDLDFDSNFPGTRRDLINFLCSLTNNDEGN